MRLMKFRTKQTGVIALDWWWPEADLVMWFGGVIRWKMWGNKTP